VTVPFQIEREREGVFNWIVQGAKRWYAEGLRPPSSVIEAGYAYQSEQDRIAQFVRDCCIVDAKAWSSFSGQFGGLYPAYTSWSRENGFSAMGSTKFIAELERVVPGYRRAERKTTEGGTRKTVRGCYGLLVNTSHDGGGVAISANENLL
jgi:putative DNA primase/helicase